MSNPFYDKKVPQFSERVLFERSGYDVDYKHKVNSLSKSSAYNKLIPSALLETLSGNTKITINSSDVYKGKNFEMNPIAADMDKQRIEAYNKKRDVNFRQIPFIYK